MTSTERNRAVGMLTMRLLVAIIFMLWGWEKVVNWGIDGVYDGAFQAYENTWIPPWILHATNYYTSYMEFICGPLLLVGLFRHFCLYVLASILVIITFGHLTLSLDWDMQHMVVRSIFVLGLLLLPQEWDPWTADNLIRKLRSSSNKH